MEQAVATLPVAAVPTADALPKPRLKISARFLLGIYLVLPLCFLAMLIDQLFLGRTLFDGLSDSPENYFFFQLIFGTPHIIASAVILAANTDYLRAFWLRLLGFTAVILVFFGVGSLFISYNVFLAIVGAATVMHVIKQQVGIGKGICKSASRLYDVWGWTLVVFGSILYYAVYMHPTFTETVAEYVHTTLWSLAALALLLAIAIQPSVQTPTGRLYFWANMLMVLLSGLFYSQSYPFLAILGPRLVHDITAFTFYIAHDVNRHGTTTRNPLYWLPWGAYWVCPALAVLLTWLIGAYGNQLADPVLALVHTEGLRYGSSFLIIGYLGLLHYYTEAFTWKHGSPYRQHLAMGA